MSYHVYLRAKGFMLNMRSAKNRRERDREVCFVCICSVQLKFQTFARKIVKTHDDTTRRNYIFRSSGEMCDRRRRVYIEFIVWLPLLLYNQNHVPSLVNSVDSISLRGGRCVTCGRCHQIIIFRVSVRFTEHHKKPKANFHIKSNL